MEDGTPGRFVLGKQSSLAPESKNNEVSTETEMPDEIDPQFKLMYLTSEGNLEGIWELLDAGVDVNCRDIDERTPLHVAACHGRVDVVELLLKRGAKVNLKDRFGSTPIADALFYKHQDVCKLMEKYGAKPVMAPMHVQNVREVPEYEIDPKEIDLTNSIPLTKGTFSIATWRGTEVAVKKLDEDFIMDEEKVKSFRDELALLQKLRHPNIVQFLGAVTQSSPMMIVTEYLPKGDLCAYLKRKGALRPLVAIKFALDIARGLNYLHENKPDPVIHRDLEPSNILRDDSGHLKVADFGISKMLKMRKTVKEDRRLICHDDSCRYIAPEVYLNEEYDTKVDVFSFALILQEMVEGCPPFSLKGDDEVAKAYARKERPPFKPSSKIYPPGLKELIVRCWDEKPSERPTFREIIACLDDIQQQLLSKKKWQEFYHSKFAKPLKCFHNIEAIWTSRHKKDQIEPSSRSSFFDRSRT
ncbi:Serine/threonine-protein kinase [Nymphaea thermarum]|nr:Serine/threonine-protein kinase [Nymphaea thermarum]